jgi:hypothetical protein
MKCAIIAHISILFIMSVAQWGHANDGEIHEKNNSRMFVRNHAYQPDGAVVI